MLFHSVALNSQKEESFFANSLHEQRKMLHFSFNQPQSPGGSYSCCSVAHEEYLGESLLGYHLF